MGVGGDGQQGKRQGDPQLAAEQAAAQRGLAGPGAEHGQHEKRESELGQAAQSDAQPQNGVVARLLPVDGAHQRPGRGQRKNHGADQVGMRFVPAPENLVDEGHRLDGDERPRHAAGDAAGDEEHEAGQGGQHRVFENQEGIDLGAEDLLQ